MNMVADKQLPRFVYRMRTVNSFFVDSLTKSHIWCANPQDFNDPFDCDINIKFIKQNLARMQSYFDIYHWQLFRSDEFVNINTANISNNNFQALINQVAKKVIRNKGIACFLSSHQNLLMWSHHADAHKGICLKFNVLEDSHFFSMSKAVKYTQAYPEYLNNKKEFVNEMFFTKLAEWSYEGKVRVSKAQKGNYPFNPRALKGIIFGCKIAETDKNTLTKLIRMVYPICKLKQATMDSSSFSLYFLEIN